MKKFTVMLILLFTFNAALSTEKEAVIFRGIASEVSDLRPKLKSGTIAVFPFDAHGFKDSASGLYLSDKLAAAISSKNKLILVEREKLNRLMKEKELSMSGVIKHDEARKIGSLLAIDAVVLGRVYRTQHGYELMVKVIDSQSGIVLAMITRKINDASYIFDNKKKDSGFIGNWRVVRTAPYLKKQNMHYEKLVLKKDSSFSLHMVNNADRLVEIEGRYRVDRNNINYRALKIYLDGSRTSFMRMNSKLQGTIFLIKGKLYFNYSGTGKKKKTRLDAMDQRYRCVAERIE